MLQDGAIILQPFKQITYRTNHGSSLHDGAEKFRITFFFFPKLLRRCIQL